MGRNFGKGCDEAMKKIMLFALMISLLMAGCATTPLPEEKLPEPTPEITPEPTKAVEIIEELLVEELPTSCIEFVGGESFSWPCGIPFGEPGYIAYDMAGNDVSDLVTISGDVCCWKTGEYELEYSFEDIDGERISQTRTVHIEAQGLPETVEEEKVIYLSFDDGPCENTETVLEILDKYNAKATFFVLTDRGEYLNILPQIKEAGHSIGIHANNHSIEKLYYSEKTLFEDYMEAQKLLYEYTGEYATISRFPGGSRTANGYLGHRMPGGMKDIEKRLADMGIRYYDWNAQIEASKTGSSKETYENFCAMVPKQAVPVCLQHDTRAYSVRALEEMLQWGTENGYTFKAMDNTVPEVHFE